MQNSCKNGLHFVKGCSILMHVNRIFSDERRRTKELCRDETLENPASGRCRRGNVNKRCACFRPTACPFRAKKQEARTQPRWRSHPGRPTRVLSAEEEQRRKADIDVYAMHKPSMKQSAVCDDEISQAKGQSNTKQRDRRMLFCPAVFLYSISIRRISYV